MSVLYIWSPREILTKEVLNEEMLNILTPIICSMGFISDYKKYINVDVFPLRYRRKHSDEIFDLIEFQWMTSGRPWFVINFDRSGSNPDTPFEWPYGLRFRARSNTGVFERWFGVGALESILRVRHAAVREINSAGQRLIEIDAFFKGGRLSPYLRQIITMESGKIKVL